MSLAIPDEIPLLRPVLVRVSGSALAFILWDWLINLDDEVKYIWQRPNNTWIKWMFLFARYFAISTQIRVIDGLILHQYHLDINAMRFWYVCQVVFAALAVMALEVVLMVRVYALYNQTLWVKFLLFHLLLFELGLTSYGVTKTYPGDDFKIIDIIDHIPDSFTWLCIAVLVVQSTIFFLMVQKCVSLRLSGSPIAKLLVRDGIVAFSLLLFLALFIAAQAAYDGRAVTPGCAWLISTASCTSCRTIINMHALPMLGPSTNTTTSLIQLSTITPDI